MPLHLDVVRRLGRELAAAEQERTRVEIALARALQEAHADAVPTLRLARESGLSRRRVERLLLRDLSPGR